LLGFVGHFAYRRQSDLGHNVSRKGLVRARCRITRPKLERPIALMRRVGQNGKPAVKIHPLAIKAISVRG
jgi:hypothetical protein